MIETIIHQYGGKNLPNSLFVAPGWMDTNLTPDPAISNLNPDVIA